MPRPKRPTLSESHYIVKRVTLDEDEQKYFAEILGIEKDKAHIKAMVADIEEVLTMHQCWEKDLNKSSTPGSRIKSLEFLQKAALDLFNAIRKLDIYTRETLYFHEYFNGPFTPADPEAECRADLIAVSKIIQRTKNALESLKPYGKQGRRKNNALRSTILLLTLLFYKHNLNIKNMRERYREFISQVLRSGDISHPDPEDQRTKFNALLVKSLP